MKKIVVLFLALALLLTACASPTPVTIVIRETAVPVATDEPADESEPTDVPADEPVATDAPAPTDEVVAPTEPADPGAAPTSTKPPAGGGDVFTDFTRDSDSLSLRCAPPEINFGVKSLNPAITSVVLFYRVVDKNSTVAAGAMVNSKDMVSDKKGNFTVLFTALDVKDDLRIANGWFEYQFVGISKSGGVVGRSDKIVKEVTFTLDCP